MHRKCSIPQLLYGRYSISAWQSNNNSGRNSISEYNTSPQAASPLMQHRASMYKYRHIMIDHTVHENQVDINLNSKCNSSNNTATTSPQQVKHHIDQVEQNGIKIVRLLDENNHSDDTLDQLLNSDLRIHYMLNYYQPTGSLVKPSYRRNVLQQMIQQHHNNHQLSNILNDDLPHSDNTTPINSTSPQQSPRGEQGHINNQHTNTSKIYIDLSYILAAHEFKTLYGIVYSTDSVAVHNNAALKRCVNSIYKQYFTKLSKYDIQLPGDVKSVIIANIDMVAYSGDLFDYSISIVQDRLQLIYTQYKLHSTGRWSYNNACKHYNETQLLYSLCNVIQQYTTDKQSHNILNTTDQTLYKCMLCNTSLSRFLKKFIHSSQCTIQSHHQSLGITKDMLYKYYLFYIELCAYRVCPSAMYRSTWSRKLYDKYMINSTHINLSLVNENIIKFIGDIITCHSSNTLFDCIEQHVFNYVLSYYYTSFIQSTYYSQFIQYVMKQSTVQPNNSGMMPPSNDSGLSDALDEPIQHNYLYISSTINNISHSSNTTVPKFTELFNMPYLVYFADYLHQHTPVYNILCFWLDIRELQQIPQSVTTNDYVEKQLIKLYNQYFDHRSVDYLYIIDHELTNSICHSLVTNTTLNGNLYNNCQLFVEKLLYDQYYIQFVNHAISMNHIISSNSSSNLITQSLLNQSHSLPHNRQISQISTFGSNINTDQSFHQLLHTPYQFNSFQSYLKLNYSYESLLFYQAIQEYKYLPQSDYMMSVAKKIYQKFLSSNAKQRITYIPQVLIDKVNTAIQTNQNITSYLYQSIEQVLYEYLSIQQYSQYLNSPQYQLTLQQSTAPNDRSSYAARSMKKSSHVKNRRRSLSMDAASRYRASGDSLNSFNICIEPILPQHDANKENIVNKPEPITLELILHNIDLLNALKHFCIRSVNIENLQFYMSVDEYRYIPSIDYMRVQANKIVHKYVLNGSKQQINLPYNIQSYIIKHYKFNPKSNLFYYAQQNIEHLLISHVLPAFIQSNEFMKFAQQHPHENWLQRPFNNKPILRTSIIKSPAVNKSIHTRANVSGHRGSVRRHSIIQKQKPVMEYKKVNSLSP